MLLRACGLMLLASACSAPMPDVCDAGPRLADGGCPLPPRAGDACTNGVECGDTISALECKLGTWVRLPCRGPGGCVKTTMVSCDTSQNLEGDACASSAEGRGQCQTDGLGTLECRDGRFVKTNTCRSCTTSGQTVICTP